jgi:transcriptional regulator with GAF, ATPase, and Fis domain
MAGARIQAVLAEHGGNVVQTAKRLGTHPRQLYRLIERFGISLDKHRR